MLGAKAVAAIALGLLVGSAGALADDKKPRPTAPWIELDLGFHLRFDWAVASDDPGNRIKQLYIEHGDIQVGFHATDWLAVHAHVLAEGVRPPLPGRNAWFRGFAMYMEELYVELDFKDVAFSAGKFNPAFGILHDEKLLRGIGAIGFTLDYKATEMLGFAIALKPDLTRHGLGQHEFTAQLFFADTTFLNHSIFTTPAATDRSFNRLGNRRLADGGLANTNRLDNVAVSLQGRGFDVLPELGYALGFRLLRASPAGLASGAETRDESGYSVALDYKVTTSLWGVETKVTPLLEWAHFRNPGGTPGVANYVTLALGIEASPWEFWLSATRRDTVAVPGTPNAYDRLLAVSIDRDITDWLKLGLGYRYQRINGVNDHVIGLRLWVEHHMEIALR